MKIVISLPDDVFEKAEAVAKTLGLSRSELYAMALNAYIQKHQKARILGQLNKFYTTEDSSLDSGLASLQYAAFPYEDWSEEKSHNNYTKL